MLVTKPVLLMLTTPDVAVFQVTTSVRFCVLPSAKTPVAVSWTPVPIGIVGLAGETAIETSCGETTVRVVEAVTPFSTAVMIVVPKAVVVAKPLLPAALLIVATEVDELH
jgi:hypothetical protein